MITIVYSTHKDENYNKKFKQHILDSVGLKDVQIIEFINHNTHSLSQVYNYGIDQSKFDIIVCCHNDIHLEKGVQFHWEAKVTSIDFSKNNLFVKELNQETIKKQGFPDFEVSYDELIYNSR